MLTTTNKTDISSYVSNQDKNVYTIYNLPEEIIAVIFAYVSRSSASFRDNLEKLIADNELGISRQSTGNATAFSEKASKFHEKWVVGYGHSSVAEHAVAHLGIEKISRLASAELEIANSFNSFTEYSQRYQRPVRGDFYVPQKLNDYPERKKEYLALNDRAYTVYEHLQQELCTYLHTSMEKKENESDRAFHLRVEKIAFEDARYVLTLATHTNLGMTGNGRALRDTLVTLLSSPYTECIELADQMRQEIQQIIPTLLKYLKPSEYMNTARQKLTKRFQHSHRSHSISSTEGPKATLTQIPNYIDALKQVNIHFLISQKAISYEDAKNIVDLLPVSELEHGVDEALAPLRFFDNPLGELQHVTYTIEMCISEANWHQLLRHNRRTHFSYGPPTTSLGYTLPPNIIKAGLEKIYREYLHYAEEIHTKISQCDPHAAHYTVTNAHHRQITATASLWELYHLINLRTSPEAQWDIQETFTQIYDELKEKHPAFVKYAKRRLH